MSVLSGQRSESVIECGASGVAEIAYHLSESQFRPLFLALVETASNASSSKENAGIFCVGANLLRRIKSLAVPWCVRLAGSLSEALADAVRAEEEDTELLFCAKSALVLLSELFDNDSTDRIIGMDVHAGLIDPIVACFDDKNLRDLVAPTVTNMAGSMGKDELWKPLNYAILLKLRDDSDERVQRACLKCIVSLWKTYKEDWLLLLPDTMPFLGELMEDEKLEKEAQQLLSLINSLLPPEATLQF
jgi:U3 small nucleolar RNA-associated protein 10